MRVVAIVGLPGSGKSEAATVAREAGLPVITMGDVIRSVATDRGLAVTESNLGHVATTLREEQGKAAVAEASLPMIEEAVETSDTVLVDGIRGIAEVEFFIDRFGEDLTLVAIDVPFATRLERIRDRGRDPTAEERADLKKRDKRELGYGMGEAIEQADITIENSGDLATFRDRIRELLLSDTL